MGQVVSKENMTIAIREYTDSQGQVKKVWKTIGELIAWDDGSKSFELWGPHGLTNGNVFQKDDQQQQPQQQQQGGWGQPQQQQQYNPDQPTQQGYGQPPQQGYR